MGTNLEAFEPVMEQQCGCYLICLDGSQQDATFLVVARSEDEAKALYRQRNPDDKGQALHVVALSGSGQILLSPGVVESRLPQEFTGSLQVANVGERPRAGYIVPDFLRGCSRAVVYTRVSTKAQASNTSFARQRESCEAFAQAAQLSIVTSYQEVKSGPLYKARPQLQAALDDLESGRAQVLLVESADRLHRDKAVAEQIMARLNAAQARLICCEEQRLDSGEHEFVLSINRAMHDYGLAVLRELGLL